MPLRADVRDEAVAATKAGTGAFPKFPALLAPAAPGAIPTIGSIEAAVILIDFSDEPGLVPPSSFNDLVFADAGKSLRTYYRENSYGQLDVSGTVSPWVRSNLSFHNYYVNRDGIPGTADDYGFDVSNSAYIPGTTPYPRNVWGVVLEAIALADPIVDFSRFDNDGDGTVDALFIVHGAIGAEATAANPSYIWSHKSNVADYLESIGVSPSAISGGTADGVVIGNYIMLPENGRLGVFCHEFGHVLGLPDLYRTDRETGVQESVVGLFDLMDNGGWLDAGVTPGHLGAWCKYQLGWIDPIPVELGIGTTARRDDVRIYSAASLTGNQSFYRVLANPAGPDWSHAGGGLGEYFLFEVRVPGEDNFDRYLPASGLAIWHVDEQKPDNDAGDGNDHLVTLVQADGEDWTSMSRDQLGESTDLWPGAQQVADFTDATTPSSALHGGAFSGAEAREIRRYGEGIEADLEDVIRVGEPYAYPNPLVMREGQDEVAFVFRPSGSSGAAKAGAATAAPLRVRIYDLLGNLVNTISSDESPLVWDCRNAAGRMVASGIYIYVMEAAGATADGRLAIIH
jgi:immune inhibitor A